MEQAVFNKFENTKKLGRRYRLVVQDVDKDRNPIGTAVVIKDPFTLKFSINRSIFNEVNSGDFEIYNLAPDTYKRLFYDYFTINRPLGEYPSEVGNPWRNRIVILEAGYQGMEMSTIFIGDMWSCYTERRNSDVITKIHAVVGLWAVSQNSDITLRGVRRNDVLVALAKDMGLKLKIYSGENNEFNRPVVVNGNSMANLNKYSGGNAFIDNDEIRVLDITDTIEGDVPLINDESGLLGVPQRENGLLTVDMIFEPRITVGQIIEIKSRIMPMFDGQYKVYGLKHGGTISQSESSSVVTELQMLVGSQVYGRFGIVKTEQ